MKRLVTTLEVELGIELTPDALDHMIDQSDGVEIRPGIETTSVPSPLPVDGCEAVQENLSLVEPSPRPDDRALAGDEAAFLRAVMIDLEPHQKTQLATVIYDPTRPGEAAAIIATAGRTATQTARVLYSVHFDTETIRDALLAPQDDPEQPTLFRRSRSVQHSSPLHPEQRWTRSCRRQRHETTLADNSATTDRRPPTHPTSSPTEPRTSQDRSTRLRPGPVTRADDQCLRNHRRNTATLGGDRYCTARRRRSRNLHRPARRLARYPRRMAAIYSPVDASNPHACGRARLQPDQRNPRPMGRTHQRPGGPEPGTGDAMTDPIEDDLRRALDDVLATYWAERDPDPRRPHRSSDGLDRPDRSRVQRVEGLRAWTPVAGTRRGAGGDGSSGREGGRDHSEMRVRSRAHRSSSRLVGRGRQRWERRQPIALSC